MVTSLFLQAAPDAFAAAAARLPAELRGDGARACAAAMWAHVRESEGPAAGVAGAVRAASQSA